MATITKRPGSGGKTVFRAEIRRKGYPKKIKTFALKRDAVKWARQIEREMDTGTWRDLKDADKYLLSDAFVRYLSSVSTKKRPTTQQRDKLSVKHLTKRLGHLSLVQATPAKVAVYRDERLKEVSPHSVRIELALLSNLFNIAKREWKVGNIDNPVSEIKKPKIPEGRCPILSNVQLARLMSECNNSKSEMLYPFIFMVLHTGCRLSELKQLRWSQVNINEGYISLIGKETKNHRRRNIPISEPLKKELLKLLEKVKTMDKHGQPTGLVFPGRDDPKKTLDVHKAFISAVKRAGLDNLPGEGRLRIHDLRHCCGSAMVMNGVDLETIRKLLGHRDISTTQRYLHVVDEHTKSAIDKISYLGLNNE
jgi:integrase